MSEVPAYADREHDIEVTRQTVYNWAKKGKRGEKMRTVRRPTGLYTTKGWVDEFLRAIG